MCIRDRARTGREVRDYLAKHEIDESTIETVINTLKEDKWIDDLAYTRAIFQSNHLSGDTGPYPVSYTHLDRGGVSQLRLVVESRLNKA